MKTIRIAGAATALIGAGIGLAGPANAELTAGTYDGAYINASGGELKGEWVFTSCGPNCLSVPTQNGARELRLQGNTWTSVVNETLDDGTTIACTMTIDNNTLTGSDNGCGLGNYQIRLTKKVG